jgi:hypothetical protein
LPQLDSPPVVQGKLSTRPIQPYPPSTSISIPGPGEHLRSTSTCRSLPLPSHPQILHSPNLENVPASFGFRISLTAHGACLWILQTNFTITQVCLVVDDVQVYQVPVAIVYILFVYLDCRVFSRAYQHGTKELLASADCRAGHNLHQLPASIFILGPPKRRSSSHRNIPFRTINRPIRSIIFIIGAYKFARCMRVLQILKH